MEEIKKDSIESGNGKPKEPLPEEPQKPITDFKVAEIWLKSGKIYLEASAEFWEDRCRALGVLSFCCDIVKTAEMPKKEESKIVIPNNGSPLNFLRNRLKGKK